MNNEKKTYQTPEAEVILFGEDIITCSGYGDYWGDPVINPFQEFPLK